MSADVKEHRTMCPMNCHPTFCGMKVKVDGDRLLEVAGDPDNPDSKGFLCVRGLAADEIVANPKRILYPMARASRSSDDWQRIGWDDAFERIVAGIEAVGRNKVALWPGHGSIANDFGVFAHAQLAMRLANTAGFQWWEPSMICWGLGGLGAGLTGAIEVNTKEDMSANSDLIVLWGANLASQPNTARHIAIAKRRGARVIAIDVRTSQACRSAHESLIVKPGTDAALALAMMHVIIRDRLHDATFVAEHTVGFDELAAHVEQFPPAWAAQITGIAAERIEAFAREYAAAERAMVLLSGSSMYKNKHGWQASRAITCLPALTGKLGKAGAGLGPRHAGQPHGTALHPIVDPTTRPPGDYVIDQMSEIIESLCDGRVESMLIFGSNFLSSFADAGRLDGGLANMRLIVCQDLFMNETIRRHADIVLPATSWLEDVGCKMTATHLYLMDQALPPAGEARSMSSIVMSLADKLGIENFYPWQTPHGHIDAVIDHPSTGHMTIEKLRACGGIAAVNVSHVAHPNLEFPTASGKIEFLSRTAAEHGLPALPSYQSRDANGFSLELRMGRSINHFHSFYDHGRALPSLVKRDKRPTLWISADDAAARGIADGEAIRIHNSRGDAAAAAKITDRVPSGTVWIHDGWPGLNSLTDGSAAIPDQATRIFPFTTGQSSYDAFVEVSRLAREAS
jgi:anaerobic selenocysteine-containing dehydrogenase